MAVGTDLLGTLHLPRQTEQQLVGNGVHQVQEGCVLVEDVVERRPLQAQVLEEEVEQTGDPGRREQPEEIKGLKYSSKRSSAFICCHGGGGELCPHRVPSRTHRELSCGRHLCLGFLGQRALLSTCRHDNVHESPFPVTSKTMADCWSQNE